MDHDYFGRDGRDAATCRDRAPTLCFHRAHPLHARTYRADLGLRLCPPGPDKKFRVEIEQRISAARSPVLTRGTLNVLAYAIQGLREMPGRKAIALFSDGFPPAAGRIVQLANRASDRDLHARSARTCIPVFYGRRREGILASGTASTTTRRSGWQPIATRKKALNNWRKEPAASSFMTITISASGWAKPSTT